MSDMIDTERLRMLAAHEGEQAAKCIDESARSGGVLGRSAFEGAAVCSAQLAARLALAADEIDGLRARIAKLEKRNALLETLLSGKVPPGVPETTLASICELAALPNQEFSVKPKDERPMGCCPECLAATCRGFGFVPYSEVDPTTIPCPCSCHGSARKKRS